jgi:uncharacterized protein YqfB (UPF0267 family)
VVRAGSRIWAAVKAAASVVSRVFAAAAVALDQLAAPVAAKENMPLITLRRWAQQKR